MLSLVWKVRTDQGTFEGDSFLGNVRLCLPAFVAPDKPTNWIEESNGNIDLESVTQAIQEKNRSVDFYPKLSHENGIREKIVNSESFHGICVTICVHILPVHVPKAAYI